MTPEQRIDAALDSVLQASGSALKNYTMQLTLDRMREAMRRVMTESYIAGTDGNFAALKGTIDCRRCHHWRGAHHGYCISVAKCEDASGFAPRPPIQAWKA